MKYTVITIKYNNAKGLRKTLASVASQTFCDFKHIIVDGGSTDGSVEIIREYADNEVIRLQGYQAIRQEKNGKADETLPNRPIASSPHLHEIYWISEPDKGIYNAMNKGIEIALGKRIVNAFNRSELVEDMNKGIRMATGEYVLFLNSGDYFIDENALQIVVDSDMKEDICYFDANFVYPNGKVEHHQYPDELSFEFFWLDALCHQATWYRIEALLDMGGYDEQYKIIGDTAMNIDLCLFNHYTYQHYPMITSCMDACGISATKEGIQVTQLEFDKYYKERLNPAIYQIFIKYQHICQSALFYRLERIQCKSLKRFVGYFVRIVLLFDKILA